MDIHGNSEITIAQIRHLLIIYNLKLLILPIIATSIALVLLSRTSSGWETSSYIKLGQFNDQPVETYTIVSARLNEPSTLNYFYSLNQIKKDPINTIQTSVQDDLGFLEIKTKAPTLEQAKQLASLVFNKLKLDQENIFNKKIKLDEEQLKKTKEAIQVLQDEKKLSIINSKNHNFSNIDLYLNAYLLDYRNIEIFKLEKEKSVIEQKFEFEKTYRVHQVGKTNITKIRQQPNFLQVCTVVFLSSLLFSLIIAYFKQNLKNLLSNNILSNE